MATNDIVKAYQTLQNRLSAATAAGQPLYGVKVVEGFYPGQRGPSDFPLLEYNFMGSGAVTPHGLGKLTVFEFDVELRLSEDIAQGTISADQTRGILPMVQKLFNAIDTTDLAGAGTWHEAPKYDIKDFVKTDLSYQYTFTLRITSGHYQRGNL